MRVRLFVCKQIHQLLAHVFLIKESLMPLEFWVL